MSRVFAIAALFAVPVTMGAQCGGEQVTECQDSEGRIVACPDSDAGAIRIQHDAGPRPDAGSADTGRNLPYEAECTPGDQGGCRFACLDTPDDWQGDGSGGFCSKPCATHAECGDPNLWRCAEVNSEYLCTRDADSEDPTASWTGPNANRTLVGSGSLSLAVQAQDDRSLVGLTATANGQDVDVQAGETMSGEDGVSVRYTLTIPLSGDEVTVNASVADGVGQTAELTKTFTVDTIGPVVSITRDQNVRPGGCVPSPSSVAVDASDNLGLIHVRIMVGEVTVATILPDNDGRSIRTGTMVDYRAAGIATGQHTLKAVAEDSAGNTAEDSFRLRIATDRSSGNPCD